MRTRVVGIVAAAAIVVAAGAIAAVLLTGGDDDGDTGGRGGDTFPTGAEAPQQQELDLQAAADAAGCELTSSKGVGAGLHTTAPDEPVQYADNPPTNGRHYEIPAEDGLYNGAPPPDTALVHSLEHGRVIIWAKPSLALDARQQIRALFDEDTYQLTVVARPNMPYAVAATAWNRDPVPDGTGRTLGCARWDDGIVDALRTFRDEHRSNGPEAVP